MATTPWYTSDKLIEAVKRKIAFPISQNTFTEDDILAFANEEMFISQVPAIMQYHEEYFVHRVQVPLLPSVSRYPIPDRAIGMKLRDLFWSDDAGNYVEMTRISPDDKGFFQASSTSGSSIHKFYVENNDIFLTPSVSGSANGSLNFFIFLRPNQLVRDSRARQYTYFTQDVTVGSIADGNTLTIVTEANQSSPTTYVISIDSSDDGETIQNKINDANISGVIAYSENNDVITIKYKDINTKISSSSDALTFESLIGFQLSSTYSGLITEADQVDFIQRKPGHKTYSYDVQVKSLVSRVESGGEVFYLKVNKSDLYTYFGNDANASATIANMQIGDYICLANETIIPQIPPDLHNALAERTAARILAAIGDTEGLQISNSKLQEIEARQGSIIDNRVDGAPQKITNRKSILRFNKFNSRRRL